MSRARKHQNGRHRSAGRVTPKGTRPISMDGRLHRSGAQPEPVGDNEYGEQLDFMVDLQRALASGHPFDLLCQASQMVELLTERPADRFAGTVAKTLDRRTVMATLLDADHPAITSLLAALAPLFDEHESARIRRELANRTDRLPAWVATIGDCEITGVWETREPVRDGDNHFIGVRWPSGHEMTAVVYVDHNVGTIVKDAFVVPVAPARLLADFHTHSEGAVETAPIDPATARARIVDAIVKGERTVPPFETESWPSCRPIIEWIAGHMPAGGTGYEWREWSEAERAKLALDFFSSAEGASLAAAQDNHDLLDGLLWFGCDYSLAGPLLISAVRAELVLVDWFPRKVRGDAAYLSQMPTVLRALIQYGHRVSRLRSEATREALDAVNRWEPEYQRLIRSRRLQSAEAIAEAARLAMEEAFDDMSDEEWAAEYAHTQLLSALGDEAAIKNLDDAPLPDEAFCWDGVPDDVRPRVEATQGMIDRCADELFDGEFRTVGRRMLARVATADPEIFRRKSSDATTAAAITWIAGKANRVFDDGKLLVKDVASWYGIKGSLSQKAAIVGRPLGLRDGFSYRSGLGDPSLLTSRRRAALLDVRAALDT